MLSREQALAAAGLLLAGAGITFTYPLFLGCLCIHMAYYRGLAPRRLPLHLVQSLGLVCVVASASSSLFVFFVFVIAGSTYCGVCVAAAFAAAGLLAL